MATVRFETPPGQQIQIDFGEKVVQIAGQPVKVYLMTAVLGHSHGFIAGPSSHSDKRLARGPGGASNILGASPSRSSVTTPRHW